MLAIQFLGSKTLSREERIQKEVVGASKKLPLVLDSLTRLDSLTYLPKDTLVYYYTIIGIENGTVDVEQFDSLMHPLLTSDLKGEKMKRFREFKLHLIYRYLYADGEKVTDIIITPDQYR
jgi:hypothetical protein